MQEDEKARLKDENSKLVKFQSIALRLNEFSHYSELHEFIEYVNKSTNNGYEVNVTLYDALVESDQTFVIDVGVGIKAENIILTSINLKNERLNKINRFIEIIDDLNKRK